MKVTAHTGAAWKKRADTVAIGVYQSAKKKAPCPDHLQELDRALGKKLWTFAVDDGFTADSGQTFVLHTHKKIPVKRVVLIGMGEPDDVTLDDFRKLGGGAVHSCPGNKAVLVLPPHDEISATSAVELAAEGALLAGYRFNKYLSDDDDDTRTAQVSIVSPDLSAGAVRKACEHAGAIAAGVNLARDLINDHASSVTPEMFAATARQTGSEVGLTVKVLTEKDLEKEGMGLMLAVGRAAAAAHPPRMVRLAYRPKKKAKRHIALVGKGVTFDSGGLDIKPAAGMLEMKIDMSGAAAVIGTMRAIGALAPEDIAVTGYLGCVENGISAFAYHPGDVLKSRKGTTVEVNNTDAEGRLVLADCIDYALDKDQPDTLIDLATLTGACMIALGPFTSGLFTADDDLASDLILAGERSGEDFWRMPLNQALRYQLKSQIADTKNTGERWGGAITAALFLEQFIDDRARWAHLDIAGPATMDREHPYIPRGGAGFAVRTLVSYLTAGH